ncbi:MAG: hypothetical protein ABSC37_16145 [Xanthobacteraceae bacterium]
MSIFTNVSPSGLALTLPATAGVRYGIVVTILGVLMRYLKPTILVLAAILVVAISIADCQARGRIGSHRVGGYNSHGKGSHYFGGR